MEIDVVASIMTIVGLATPILLAGLGELVTEKSGVLNLGVEGMMLLGAIGGFAVAATTGSPWLAVVGAALAGAGGALIFGLLTLSLSANQTATGLALTLFGTGLSSVLGVSFTGRTVEPFGPIFPDALARDPFWRLIFGYSPMTYLALLLVPAVAWFLRHTRAGLLLRAVGENADSAHSLGYPVIRVRYAAVAFGGALAGLAGAYFSLVITPMWAEKMTAGRGWIALALVVFAGWREVRLLVGAYLFGGLMWLELFAKASGFSEVLPAAQAVPSQLWAAMPFLVTVLVLALLSSQRKGGRAPACLGKPFLPSD